MLTTGENLTNMGVIHIGKKIETILAEKGFSKSWLANAIGTSRQNLGEILKKRSIQLDQLQRISQALNVDLLQYYDEKVSQEKIDSTQPRITLKIEVELHGSQLNNLETIRNKILKVLNQGK